MDQAIVVADRLGAELAPFTAQTPVALLPVGGKPLLVHTLEALAQAGVRRVLVLVSPFADAVQQAIGDGARWGLQLTFALTRGEEHPATVLGRLSRAVRRPEPPFVALRGDVLHGFDLKDWLDRATALAAGPARPGVSEPVADAGNSLAVWAQAGPRSASCGLHWAGPADLAPLVWPSPPVSAPVPAPVPAPVSAPVSAPVPESVPGVAVAAAAGAAWLPVADAHPLLTPADYHRANLDAAAGRLPNLLLPGRDLALGLRAGRTSQVSARSLRQGVALVGERCRIAADAVLLGEVVIGDDVIVDRRATIRNSLVLPHSYVGSLVEVRNAILCGNSLLRVDSGALLHITDAGLLADLREATVAGGLSGPLHQVLGLLALLASAPLWPLALAATWWTRRAAARPDRGVDRAGDRAGDQTDDRRGDRCDGWLCPVRLRGNRREPDLAGQSQRRDFTAWAFATPVPLLRHLPRLLAVVTGDLRLVGVAPLTPAQADALSEDWERVREQVPAGLIGPTQLDVPADAPREERLMSDVFYARQRTPAGDLYYLGRALLALFTPRAWFGAGR